MPDNLKIMLVESNKATALAMAATLREQNWDVVSSSDAIHALNVGVKEKPGVILLSTQLPGGSGLQVLKRLRSLVHTAITPVIALCESPAARAEMLTAGAQAALERPVDSDALVRAIRQHAGQPPVVTEAPKEIIRDPGRLAALTQTGLLDSPPSKLYDQLTWLAAKLLHVPVALLSLVDKDRQFFKSQIGLPDPIAAARQTPLSHSFCQWVVTGKEQLAITDAREQPVLRDNLAVRDLNVIAYAGVPIAADSAHVIGSFCAIDSTPRQWTAEELRTLRDLAAISEAYAVSKIESPAATPNNFDAARALARGGAAAARLFRTERTRLDASCSDVLLRAIELQAERLAELVDRLSAA